MNGQLLELTNMFKSLIKRMSQLWNGRMNDSYSITLTQFRTLYILNTKGPQKAAELADILCVTSGAITGLADKLIAKQFIQRQRSEEDRRVVYLSITDQGKEMIGLLLEEQKEVMSLVFKGMHEDDVAHLKRLFMFMLDNIEQFEKE
ncbi:MarR family winged helix-turn-helix transcriptional regulator [Paenibacillus ginsengarvi]|uniref:MarR family transcriptional regulator n=1 Tax=Paenibacillus ginsengarvi TaxID=400777 RepID=A0A3B0CMY6_9BACL|nr:MarR family transcriptional regulator [Paenibacillus ginsengarvi]RKN87035.1 MarR family transcriptional regulator [Paenibacillus ginsengarvi]